MTDERKLPSLPKEAPGRPATERYREQFGVIVLCTDEAEHKEVYERLMGLGFKCKVVRT
ncbi:hypothetical protein RDSD_000583 [Oleidesulfovibrio alaskensis]|jgi:hypothetical protein|uniref:hypothetical protein n=1 Tax=Oleidesulfovibrio alaskensis TaxID=58180 RepID=UPI000045C622|nr:hypothetical protein [Oleidesulfovibrio alaskensis]